MNLVQFFNDTFWATATLISLLTLPITNLINSKFELNGIWKQVIAWATSIILTIVAYFGELTTFNNPIWLSIPLTGIICGLSANGIYDIPIIKEFIKKYFSLIPNKGEA